MLLASLNSLKLRYMGYILCSYLDFTKIKKFKKGKKYCEKPDIILIRHSDTLLFISL